MPSFRGYIVSKYKHGAVKGRSASFASRFATRAYWPTMPIRQLVSDVRAEEQAELARLESGRPVDTASAGSLVQPVASQQTVAEQEMAGLGDKDAGVALSTGCEQQEARAALVTEIIELRRRER